MLERGDRQRVIGHFDQHPLPETSRVPPKLRLRLPKKGAASHRESSLHLGVTGEREQYLAYRGQNLGWVASL